MKKFKKQAICRRCGNFVEGFGNTEHSAHNRLMRDHNSRGEGCRGFKGVIHVYVLQKR